MAAGRLKYTTVGARRLIDVKSLLALVLSNEDSGRGHEVLHRRFPNRFGKTAPASTVGDQAMPEAAPCP